MTWVQTYTGRVFYPLNPKPEDVSLADIAWALSHQCRFNGHCNQFYSVAEHSILVSENVPQEDALWGLMHDAAEAYLPDVARPIKASLIGFQEIENKVLEAIAIKFNLPPQIPESIKKADLQILASEQKALMPNPPQAWDLPYLPIEGVSIVGLEPILAFRLFMKRYWELVL